MSAIETAAALATPVSHLGGGFMSSAETYQYGSEHGIGRLDFYVVGRTGYFGPADAAVACAAMVFFEPTLVAQHWNAVEAERRPTVAALWADAAHSWGESRFS